MESFVRISALLWADILVGYALFVMQTYLTDVWKLEFTHAAAILNIWGGICLILPVFFLFLVDSVLGNFKMLLISSTAYTVGIGLISMSTPPVLGNPCKQYEPQCIGHTQKNLLYIGLALVAVGISGNLVSVNSFLEEQKLETETKKKDKNLLRVMTRTITRRKKPSGRDISCLQLLGYFLVALIPVTGAIALPYIKPWSLRFGIPAICTLVATLLFWSGVFVYKYEKNPPEGSPLTNVCRVFVACFTKISRPFPLDNNELYRREGEELRRFTHTRLLRCVEKAAIISPNETLQEQENNRWKLCSIAEVEEAKIAIRMVPMWTTFIVLGIVSSIGNTYFIEQANHMNRKIGAWNVPLPFLLMLFGWAKSLFSELYSYFLKGYKTYGPTMGIALSMIFSVLCCITAARIELKRLKVIQNHDLLDFPNEDIPMSIYWLLFQFFLLAGLDSFLESGVAGFYADQAPKSMENCLVYFTKGITGLGFMFSVVTVHVVGKISEKGGKKNWFQPTLNRSRLDRYYWVLAALSAVNLIAYVLVAYMYRYKEPNPEQDQEENPLADQGGGGGGGGESVVGLICCCC